MDLKNLVQAYQNQINKYYYSTLHTQVEINDIFSKNEIDRLKSKIEKLKNVDLINGSIDYILGVTTNFEFIQVLLLFYILLISEKDKFS